jgi:DNA-binding NarL/FixJ family response regulator
MPRFEYSPRKEEAMQALTFGMSKQECAIRFGLSTRTVERYFQEIKDPEEARRVKLNNRATEKARYKRESQFRSLGNSRGIVQITITIDCSGVLGNGKI